MQTNNQVELELRRTTAEDCRFLFELRNDEAVRKNSFQTDEIPYVQHQNWFSKKIADENVLMYILELRKEKIGQVRVDIENHEGEISYALCEKARGKGFATWMLQSLEEKLRKEKRVKTLLAEVKAENTASRKIFLKLGYEEMETAFGYSYRKDIDRT